MKLKKITLLGLIFSISIMLVMIPDIDHSSGNSRPAPTIKLSWDNDDWHDGTDLSTSELTLEYKEVYESSDFGGPDGGWDGIDDGSLRQKMEISYNDSTNTLIGFDFVYIFDGCIGIDVDNRSVTDWNEVDNVDPTLTIESNAPPEYGLGRRIVAQNAFLGFKIYNGSSADLNIIKAGEDPDNWEWFVDAQDWLADLNFRNCSMRIGQVTLDTEDYSSNGTTSIKSIVKFDIHINATIGIETNKEEIDATLSYTINHTVDYTKLKYGLDIDWSNAKDFPTRDQYGTINEGDPYCLLFQEGLAVRTYNGGIDQIGTFSTNDENDTAIFKKDGHLLSEHETVKAYNLKGESTLRNTTRFYYEISNYENNQNFSSIFVFFDGFSYNQSTGLECDPTITLYCGDGGQNIAGYEIWILALVGLTSICLYLYKIKHYQKKFKS